MPISPKLTTVAPSKAVVVPLWRTSYSLKRLNAIPTDVPSQRRFKRKRGSPAQRLDAGTAATAIHKVGSLVGGMECGRTYAERYATVGELAV